MGAERAMILNDLGRCSTAGEGAVADGNADDGSRRPTGRTQASLPARHRDVAGAPEHRLRAVLDAVGVGTWEMDPRLRLIAASESHLALCDLPQGGFGDPTAWLARVHPEDQARLRAAIHASFASGAPLSHEFRIVRSEGREIRWLQLRADRRSEAGGQTDILVGISLDVTDIMRARQGQDEQAARLRATYACAPVGLCLIDRDLRYLEINQRLAAINGVPAEAHLGLTLSEAVPGIVGDIEPVCCQVFATGQPIEARVLRGRTRAEPEAEQEWMVSYHPVWGNDGTVTGVNIAVLTVTELRQVERDLRHALERAEAAELASGRFLAAMNHEFRTPVSIIVGFADLLRQAAEAGASLHAAEPLEEIQQAARHLLQLVEDATRYAKITRAAHHLERQPVRLGRLVTEAAQVAAVELSALGTRIALRPSPHEELSLSMHLPTLREGLAGLLREVARRAPRGSAMEALWFRDGGDAVVELRCPQLVLTPQDLDQLRTPLGAADLHGRGLEGAGFGLAIAEAAAWAHGGWITTDSTAEAGTRFRVTLPCGPIAAETKKAR